MHTTIYFNDNDSAALANHARELEKTVPGDSLVVFPEVVHGVPLSPAEIIDKIPSLMGKTVVTGHELVWLRIATWVEFEHENHTNFSFFYVKEEEVKQLTMRDDGEFTENIGLFRHRADILFGEL